MPSPDVLDFAKLLAPIPGDKPTGIDLRTNAGPTSPYYQVKDARNAARAAERQMEGGLEDAPMPDWKAVVTHATKTLSTVSKDLEVAAYLIEALCRTNGFAGLRDGFKLTKGLVEQFWDNLYPVPDEEGIATKVAPLTGLNGDDSEGTLIAPINRIPMMDDPGLGRLNYSNYLQAAATEKIIDPKAKEKKIAAGALSMEIFQKGIDGTPASYFRNMFDDITATLDEFSQLGTLMDTKAGSAAPPTSSIRTTINNVLDAVNNVAKAKLAITMPTAAPVEEKAEEAAKPGADGKPAAGGGGGKAAEEEKGEKLPNIRNRDDALNAILLLGNYFRRTEPSSLVPFALEQAVRWARMSLPELLVELIPDDGPRKALFKQVGIRALEGGGFAGPIAGDAAPAAASAGSVPPREPKKRMPQI